MTPHTISCLLLAIALIVQPIAVHAAFYLTRDKGDGKPDKRAFSQFDCNEKVYAVIQGIWPAGGNHLIEARWIGPHGKQREQTRLNFKAVDGTTRAWVWLRLHRGEQSLFDKMLMEEDTSMQEFIGEWKLDLRLDGKR